MWDVCKPVLKQQDKNIGPIIISSFGGEDSYFKQIFMKNKDYLKKDNKDILYINTKVKMGFWKRILTVFL